MHKQQIIHLFAQYGHVQVCALRCLVYMIHMVSRYLDLYIYIIKLSLDPGQAPVAHAQAAGSSFLRTVWARTGICSS